MKRPLHAAIVSCLVRNSAEEILLICHPRRGWELPQGHVEAGEDLLAAACREVLEETGYRVAVERLAAVFSKLDPEPGALVFGFHCRCLDGKATPSEESLEVAWFPPEQARELPEHPVNRARLEALLTQRAGLRYQTYRMAPFRLELDCDLGESGRGEKPETDRD